MTAPHEPQDLSGKDPELDQDGPRNPAPVVGGGQVRGQWRPSTLVSCDEAQPHPDTTRIPASAWRQAHP